MDGNKNDLIENKKPGLLTSSHSYKPFRYPWAFDFWKRQQQVHWMPEEVPLGEDCKDWVVKLNDNEKNLLTQIFRFFTQSDVEVNDNYMERYSQVFKPTEVKMMLSAFSNIETVHIAAYALLLETIGMPDTEFSAFLKYKEMADKHDYMQKFTVDSNHEIAKTVAMFGGFKIQGKTAKAAMKILEDALAIQDAGCFMLEFEAVPAEIARVISKELEIPTIGIGAGNGTDGQILLGYDLLGVFTDFKPKFTKRYSKLTEFAVTGLKKFVDEVKNSKFPDDAYESLKI